VDLIEVSGDMGMNFGPGFDSVNALTWPCEDITQQ
jgi:hypothetical protein